MPLFPSPPARVEAVARSARGPRSRSRCVRAWPHYTPPLAPPTQQVSKEVVIFTTLITPIDLAITPINFQSKSAFFACWKRVAPSRLQSVRGAIFGTCFFISIATFLDAVLPLKGPCVSAVSVWIMWALGTAPGVHMCDFFGCRVSLAASCDRIGGGEGGWGVVVCESTCGTDGPKLYRASV